MNKDINQPHILEQEILLPLRQVRHGFSDNSSKHDQVMLLSVQIMSLFERLTVLQMENEASFQREEIYKQITECCSTIVKYCDEMTSISEKNIRVLQEVSSYLSSLTNHP